LGAPANIFATTTQFKFPHGVQIGHINLAFHALQGRSRGVGNNGNGIPAIVMEFIDVDARNYRKPFSTLTDLQMRSASSCCPVPSASLLQCVEM
jgi:hypothetical protein